MTADVGTLQRLPKIIPEGVARELAYTGRRLPRSANGPSRWARQRGVRHPDDVLAGVMEIAAEIASKSPLAIWGTKGSVNFTRPLGGGLAGLHRHLADGHVPAHRLLECAAAVREAPATVQDLPPRPGGLLGSRGAQRAGGWCWRIGLLRGRFIGPWGCQPLLVRDLHDLCHVEGCPSSWSNGVAEA